MSFLDEFVRGYRLARTQVALMEFAKKEGMSTIGNLEELFFLDKNYTTLYTGLSYEYKHLEQQLYDKTAKPIKQIKRLLGAILYYILHP